MWQRRQRQAEAADEGDLDWEEQTPADVLCESILGMLSSIHGRDDPPQLCRSGSSGVCSRSRGE